MYNFVKFVVDHIFLQNRDTKYAVWADDESR
jgi:hypothetical protein